MQKRSRLIGFLTTSDLSKAREFYEDILGLTYISENPFAIIFDADGTMLRIQKVDHVDRREYTVLGWSVDDIKKEIRTLNERGISFIRYKGMNQDGDGVWISPDKAKVVWFKDPDGNTLSLTEFQ